MNAQDRIARKEAEHAKRQENADANDLQPESLRDPQPPKAPKAKKEA